MKVYGLPSNVTEILGAHPATAGKGLSSTLAIQ
jgi:hypothetical protein